MSMAEQEELFGTGNKQEKLKLSAGGDEAPQRSELVPALDVPQNFAEASSYQVRSEFEELVRLDLLGPWGGKEEVFPFRAMGPRERYLVGMLGPKHLPKGLVQSADNLPDTETGVEGDGAPDLPEVQTPQNVGRIWASSMGLSFHVGPDIDAVNVRASWGRYAKTEAEDEDGIKRFRWSREPVEYDREVRLDGKPSYRIPLTAKTSDEPGVHLAVTVRPSDAGRVVELTLINAQLEPVSNPDTAWLFQAELVVTALDGAKAIFLPIDDPADDLTAVGSDQEEMHLRLLYRNERRYASGRNVAVHADVRDGERVAHRLTTTWIPAYDVPATVAPTDSPYLRGAELSMDTLVKADVETLKAGLAPLADGYSTWLDERAAQIGDLPETLRPAAETAVAKARQAAERIAAGVRLLTDPQSPRHDQALRAFRFANEAMALQRRHTAIGQLRGAEGLTYAQAEQKVKEQGAEAASWRPFQLAFVLLNLPSLTDPAHPERAADHTGVVDLLFFPTGGGKTEAYLGLTAYTFAIRRLQKTIGTGADARSGMDGVAVLMRYTLRLLTAQQFQRAAALVCAAEILRQRDPATWGGEPFRIGLWVGGGVSPNWYDEARDQIDAARQAGDGKRTNVLQTLSCPWCGERLHAHHDLRVREELRRVFLFCPNGEGDGACPFSERESATGEGLPILTVDEEIYRYTPSLVVATVDKLAQLPWSGYAGMLFGRVAERCPRHGYRHDDLTAHTKCGRRHTKKGALPAVESVPVTRLRPPDLIIQDELHLISGALGTTVGLFEAAVAELCTWRVPDGSGGSRLTGPKIVASTATTKRADKQVSGVFGRGLAVFPPQVIDVADTFFSRQVPVTEDAPGRRYLGLCAHGVRLKSAEIRLAEILLLAGQTLFDKYGGPADPYMTVVGYFNATRELAGMRRYLDDDVATRVRMHGPPKELSNRLVHRADMLTIQELTSRISSADISDVLKRLEYGFDPELDTTARRRQIGQEWADILKEKKRDKRRAAHPVAERWSRRRGDDRVPVDVVLATSMLQVGVDVSRFGLMVVTGQPKNTAEYIQASSRVGRDAKRPGLVLTLYNWSRPRDLAHYEDFEHYHATFYRQVEALSVTPYTRRALDRGTAATFIAAVRHSAERFSRDVDAHDVPLDDPIVEGIVQRWLDRAEAIRGRRGRDYLDERIKVVKDEWNKRKTGSTRLGYQTGSSNKQQLTGLIEAADGDRWGTLTVGRSMRETENEINLLLPGGGEIFTPAYGAPEWTFGPPSEPDPDEPVGDELGESTLNGKGK
jgi:hypothetical protein